jgi:hypothetical protein
MSEEPAAKRPRFSRKALRVFVCGDSHTDVWRPVREHLKESHLFVVNRIPAISAQGMSNPSSALQAASKFGKMIQAKLKSIDLLLIQIGSVDLDFVVPYKMAKSFQSDQVFHLEMQLQKSIQGLSHFIDQILSFQTPDGKRLKSQQIVLVGVHPPTVADEHYRECLNREHKDRNVVQMEERDENSLIPKDLTLFDLKKRSETARKFNEKLQDLAKLKNCLFLTIFNHCIDEETGTVKPELMRQGSVLDVHLQEEKLTHWYCEELLKLSSTHHHHDDSKDSQIQAQNGDELQVNRSSQAQMVSESHVGNNSQAQVVSKSLNSQVSSDLQAEKG